MPAVTISAGYGAGGSVVAPRVAELLDVPMLDRAISSQVADQLHVTVEEARGGAARRSLVERFFGVLAPLAGGVIDVGHDGESVATESDDAARFREAAEGIVRSHLATGVVVLGRAGGAMLRDEPAALRVRLFGDADARARQGAGIEGVDEATAAGRLPDVDRARAQYVRRLYGCDIDDPQLYDVQLDSTRIPLDVCADLIAAAYRGLPVRGA